MSRETQDLARRLLDYEAAASEPAESAIGRVFEKLRPPLCTLVGVADYRLLVARALMLAKAETASLAAVQVTADGSLLGLSEFEPQRTDANTRDGGIILIAEILGLFLGLIGPALTLRLLHEVAPHLEVATDSGTPMPFEDILLEVEQLNNVSKRLDSLAGQNSSVEDALMSISENIRSSATVLEVLTLIKNKANKLPKDVLEQQASKRYLM